MLQITVLPFKPQVLEGVSGKTGKPYRMIRQAAVVAMPDGTGGSISLNGQRVNGRDEPYAPGQYTLAPESFYVKDGALTFSPRLVPVAEGRGGAK